MKKIKKILVLTSALTVLATPITSYAATSDTLSIETEIQEEASTSNLLRCNHCSGYVKYDAVILNKTLGSDNVYLGQVNYGDRFCILRQTTNSQGTWIYVKMCTGQNTGKYGWIYKAYTNIY